MLSKLRKTRRRLTSGAAAFALAVAGLAGAAAASPAHAATMRVPASVADYAKSTEKLTDRLTDPESLSLITGLSPSGGVSSGGTVVTITGTNLSSTTAVYFGGTAASAFTVDSDTQVTAVTRAQTNGTVDVTVTTAAGISPATTADQFTFFSPVPVITSVSPYVGIYLGGTTVTITGIRFPGTFRVSFGGVAASYTLDSPTQITAIAPPISSYMTAAGSKALRPNLAFTVDVRVSTDVDTSAISAADHYTYAVPG
ncbi:IPT/TIG domain-containing protein [Catenulispora rubra]|uniref:IPT/TIG domain-containing protein n=1 Tax=Catenulispora rubra TaxID=280293 RepID=UPI0018925F98|nr:IPT/TIG domain-containing protein [Catenulispora rubra]